MDSKRNVVNSEGQSLFMFRRLAGHQMSHFILIFQPSWLLPLPLEPQPTLL